MDDFQGKAALVTGGGQGIGRAIALRLAVGGAQVAVADIRQAAAETVAQEVRRHGGHALGVGVDVKDADQVQRMLREVMAAFGGVDILVNNAGIFNAVPFVEMTEAQWDEMIDVHLKGTFLCSRAAVQAMIARRSGVIINIASTSGITGGTSGAHYAAAKGGIVALTRSLGKELARHGVRVNAVAPSKIETAILQGVDTAEARRQLIAKIPIGRIGQPEDIAEVVAFLASEKASYIVGEVIVASGGY